MPYIAGHPFSQKRNEFLLGRAGATAPGILGLQRGTVDPGFGAADGDFLYNLNGNLTWEAAGVTTTLGAVGGVGTTWESLYANDTAWALTGAFTITQSSNNTITINKTAVGAGAVLTITNAGTGNDITGNAGNWSVTAAGAATVASLASAGAITCTAISDVTAGATLQVDGNAAGGVNIGSTSTGAITIGRATTITTGGLTVSDTGITVSDGITDLIDNSNIAAGLQLTNNTVTTFGVGGVSTGVVLFRSTSLSTGALLSLQLTELSLTGGFYLRCFDVTAGADVFTIGEDGAVVITGVAANVLTLTLGDVLLSDGSITVTDADNAATFSCTNNTVTTANAYGFAGSGVFTGTGATSFFLVSPSGLTTGTALAITAAALTTGSGAVLTVNALTTGIACQLTSTGTILTTGAMLDIVADSATTAGAGGAGRGLVRVSADALTTGVILDLSSTSVNLAAGLLADFDHTASGAIVAKTAQLVNVTASRDNTAAAAISDDYDAFSITRTNINTNAGGSLTAAGSVLRLENIATQTAGTLTDTTAGLEIVMDADGTGNGITLTHNNATTASAIVLVAAMATTASVIQITTNALSTGTGLVWTANGITTGAMVSLIHGVSVIAAGGSMARIASTSIDTSTTTGCLLDLSSTASLAGTQVLATLSGLTTGIGVSVVGNALTTGELVFISHITSVIADGGSLLRVSSTSIDTGGATNGTVLDLIGSGQLAGVCALETYAALTTGTAHRIVANALTTGILLDLETSDAGMAGSYIRCFDGAAVDFSVGEDGRVVLAGAAAITAIAVTAGDITTADGAVASSIEAITLGAAAATFAADSNYVRLTGDAGGNSVTTITGGVSGQVLFIEFQDALVTIVNNNGAVANTIDLVGADTTFADDAVLTLVFNGTSWYEAARSVNA